MSEHRLYTWYWTAALREDTHEDLTLVRTSVGGPRQMPREILRQLAWIKELTPFGLLGKDLPWAEFERRYIERISGYGVEYLEHKFEEVRDQTGGRPLALLCFEHTPSTCHRGLFARWWEEKTGELVPEYHPPKPIRGGAPEAAPEPPAQGTLL